VVADPEIDAMFPGVKRARVTITDNNGTSHTAQVDHAKGSPKNPMSDDEIISKFRANASDILDKETQDKVIDLTWRFDELDGITAYLELLH
jgi:2-methylcitrate dehydratase